MTRILPAWHSWFMDGVAACMSSTVMLATAISDAHEILQMILVGVTILFMSLGCVMRWRKLRQNKLDE